MESSTKHEYDLDVSALYYEIKNNLSEPNIPDSKDVIENLRIIVELYFQSINEPFNNEPERFKIIIVKPTEHQYKTFLAMKIAYTDVYKLDFFINHQKILYDKHNLEIDFSTFLEFDIYSQLKWMILLQKGERLKIVSNWIKRGREIFKNEIPDIKPEQKHKLFWISKDETKLKSISKKLYKNKFFEKPLDFYRAISKNTPTVIKKEPESIAYLISELFIKGHIECTVRNGYIKASNNLFCAFSEKNEENISTKVLVEKFKRSSRKYNKQRGFIDSIILYLK